MLKKRPTIGVIAFMVVSAIGFTASDLHRSVTAQQPCSEAPTIECMAIEAYEIARSDPDAWPVDRIASGLAQLGLFDEAAQLIPLVRARSANVEASHRTSIIQRIAEQRVVSAARASPVLEVDFGPIENLAHDRTISSDPRAYVASSYYLAALDLLGRNPYGSGASFAHLANRNIGDPEANRLIASEMARRIETIIPDLRAVWQPDIWQKPAEIYALLADRENALRALRNGLPSDTLSYVLVEDILAIAEADAVLQILADTGMERGRVYLSVAQAMIADGARPDKIAGILRRAFDLALVSKAGLNEGSVEFDVQRKIVSAFADIGYVVEAEQLAHRMDALSREARSIFPWFNVLTVAATFIDLGLEADSRRLLDQALELLPKDESQVLGMGFVSGPITFSNLGIDNETHAEFAAQYARLGDIAAFDKHIVAVRDDYMIHAWKSVLRERLDHERVASLLDRAPPKLASTLVATAAHELLQRGDIDGAAALIRRLLERPEKLDYYAFRIAALIGVATNDSDLERFSLAEAVDRALQSRDPLQIVRAAVFRKSLEFSRAP